MIYAAMKNHALPSYSSQHSDEFDYGYDNNGNIHSLHTFMDRSLHPLRQSASDEISRDYSQGKGKQILCILTSIFKFYCSECPFTQAKCYLPYLLGTLRI
jgi:hypothetical protein